MAGSFALRATIIDGCNLTPRIVVPILADSPTTSWGVSCRRNPRMRRITRPRFKLLSAGPLALVFAIVAAVGSNAGAAGAATNAIGLSQLLAVKPLTSNVRAIAEFSAVPSATQVSALKSLGLLVQPMQKVRLAVVYGAVSAMKQAVNSGLALDVYPDTPVTLLDTASSNAM